MEVSALRHPGLALRGPTPLLRLQSDERLVAMTRRGNQAAFEALVARYQARLLALLSPRLFLYLRRERDFDLDRLKAGWHSAVAGWLSDS